MGSLIRRPLYSKLEPLTERRLLQRQLVFARMSQNTSIYYVGLDFASSERQAAPLLAADLAQNVAALITEGAW